MFTLLINYPRDGVDLVITLDRPTIRPHALSLFCKGPRTRRHTTVRSLQDRNDVERRLPALGQHASVHECFPRGCDASVHRFLPLSQERSCVLVLLRKDRQRVVGPSSIFSIRGRASDTEIRSRPYACRLVTPEHNDDPENGESERDPLGSHGSGRQATEVANVNE